MTSRRNFIKTLSAGTSFSALSLLAPATQIFEAQKKELFKNKAIPDASDYLLDSQIRYLNHGSIGTIPKIVHEAHVKYLSECETNPWFYMWSGVWNEPIEEARKQVAEYLNAESDEISFPHNTTEIFNVLALGLPIGSGDEVLLGSLNHGSAMIPFQQHASKRGYTVRTFDIPVDDLTKLTKDELLNLYDENISEKTKVLVLPHLDNSFGVRQPVKEITALARQKGIKYIAVDTAQSMGMLPIDVKDFGIDVIATSAHKWIQAPKGISIAFFSEQVKDEIDTMWIRSDHPYYERSARKFENYGTRNLPEVVTLGNAVEFQKNIDPIAADTKLKTLWETAQTLTEKNPNTKWRSPENWELSGSLYAVQIDGIKPSELSKKLFTEHGVVFRAFDNYSTIRLSPNLMNTVAELEELFGLI